MNTLIKDDHLCVDLQLPERDYTGEEIIVIELRIGCIKVRERERERKKKERKRERDTERERVLIMFHHPHFPPNIISYYTFIFL